MAVTTINISLNGTSSLQFSAPTQQVTILDSTNRNYLRQMFVTNQGVKLVHQSSVVQVPITQLFAVAAAADPTLTWPPIILGQPTSSIVSIPFTPPVTASFYVSASAEIPITYSWQSGSTSTGSFVHTSDSGSAAAQVYVKMPDTTSLNSYWRCILSNGSGFVTSSVVQILGQP